MVGTKKIEPGGPAITQSGIMLSLASGATAAVIGTSIVPLPEIAPVPSAATGGISILTYSNSDYVVGGETLIPGGPAITISGVVVSIPTSGAAVVIGTSTISLADSPLTPNAPAIIFGDSTVTANPQSGYVIGSQTLEPGGSAITVSSTVLSLAPSATALVVGQSTIPLGQTAAPALPVITVAGTVITANSQSDFVVGFETLAPGGLAITIDGTALSLASGATALIVDSSTEVLTSSVPGLGAIIMTALGGGLPGVESLTGTSSSGLPALETSPVAGFSGHASRFQSHELLRKFLLGFLGFIIVQHAF